MKKLLKFSAVSSLVLLALVLGSALFVDQALSTEVQFITPNEPEVVELEKMMWVPGDPVAQIYGVPTDRPSKVVFADKSKLIVPEEDDELLLLPVDKQAGENPLQTKTVWFIAQWAALALILASAVSFAGTFFYRRD